MKFTQDEFVEKAKSIHKNKYTYDKTNYLSANKHVTITCPVHGDFTQRAAKHLRGRGCPVCGGTKKLSHAEYIEKAKQIHDNKYDYSKTEYVSMAARITVTCPEHGDFTPAAKDHIHNKSGCPICGREATTKHQQTIVSVDEFNTRLSRVVEAQDNKYKLSWNKNDYSKMHDDFPVTCSKHGTFSRKAYAFLQFGCYCPKCYPSGVSVLEKEVVSFLEDNNIQLECNNRTLIAPYELDIVIPSLRLAVEFNGTYWHSSKMSNMKYKHKLKSDLCNEKKYQLIHIDEHLWVDPTNKQKLKSLLLAKCNIFKERYYARKCVVKVITPQEGRKFLNLYHIQNSTNSSVYIGLYYKDDLVSVMSFGKSRYLDATYELIRYCCKAETVIIGGASKIFRYFLRNYCGNNDTIISYANRDWSNGNLYENLGFVLTKTTRPNYKWIKQTKKTCKVYSRYQTQKSKLQKLLPDYDESKTEKENMEAHNFYQLFDSGNLQYTYTHKQ